MYTHANISDSYHEFCAKLQLFALLTIFPDVIISWLVIELNCILQGFSWTEIRFGHFVRAAPILFGHLEIF